MGDGLRAAFMREMLQRILMQDKHPLRFLIDPTTRGWKSRHMHSMEPTVQAGHLVSRHSGQPERFALEDSTWNQWSSNRGETQGAIFMKSAVDIQGVPVEVRTAMTWEAAGQLDPGTVKNARPTHGWVRR